MLKPELVEKKIFVVDDNPNNLGVIAGYLKGAGYKVSVAPNGKTALGMVERIKPVLILLDIKMPDINGYDVCRHLKANKLVSDIPVIFLTALNDIESTTMAFKAGGTDFITKPVNKRELLSRVGTHIENYLYRNNLKDQVRLRTLDLEKTNASLKIENNLRIETENKLRKSEERLKLAIYGANDGIWDWNLVNHTVFFDDRYYTIAGYEPGSFPSHYDEWKKRVHPNDIDLALNNIEQYLSKKTDHYSVDFRFLRNDNSYMWLRGKGKVVAFSKDGTPTRFIGTHSDIDDLKRAEEEVRHLRNYLTSIFNSMPSMVIGLDEDLHITRWNDTASMTTGFPFEEVKGKPLVETIPWMRKYINNLQFSPTDNSSCHYQGRPQAQGENVIYNDITIFPLKTNVNKGYVLRIDDVTERVRLEEAMVQSEKMNSVGGLAAGMAHEINNPLAGIMQSADVILNRLSNLTLPANISAAKTAGTTIENIDLFMKQRGIIQMLHNIISSGTQASEIVQTLIGYTRQDDTIRMSHNVSEILDKSIDLMNSDIVLQVSSKADAIPIVKDYSPELPKLPCKPSEIQQAIINILKNSVKSFSKIECSDPQIIVRTDVVSGRNDILIEIEDNGCGIDEITQKKIFEPFFTTKSPDEGTGLGLSVAYFIITLTHNGHISVKSQADRGTIISIQLPTNASP